MNVETRFSPARVDALDWTGIGAQMDARGYAKAPALLRPEECDELIAGYDDHDAFRKTVAMARYRFGQGEYKYWREPLPDVVQTLRERLYPHLAVIVNGWFRDLGVSPQLPATFADLRALCHRHDQRQPTPLILRYEAGGFNTLHQDLYGEIYFPLQAVIALDQPGVDYEGGEFVLIEQHPRAQSKAVVLTPNKGDLLLFATNFRPGKSARGFYRTRVRHGVSEVRCGRRHAVGVIFHDAQS